MSRRRSAVVRVTRVPMDSDTARPWVVHVLPGWDPTVLKAPRASTWATSVEANRAALSLATAYHVTLAWRRAAKALRAYGKSDYALAAARGGGVR